MKATIPVMSAYILRHLPDLLLREDVGQLTVALEDLTKRITKTIDLPDDKTRFRVGPCPELAGEDHCKGEVWAYFPQGSGWGQEAPPPSMRCKTCGMVWFGQHFNRAGNRIAARQSEMDKAKAATEVLT